MGSSEERDAEYYVENLCHYADKAYRFAFMLTLDRDTAARCVDACYDELALQLRSIVGHKDPLIVVVAACWRAFNELKLGDGNSDHDNWLVKVGSSHSPVQRAALGAADEAGLLAVNASRALGIKKEDYFKELAIARRRLAGAGPALGEDDVNFYSQVDLFMDGLLPKAQAHIFTDPERQEQVEAYKMLRGRMQIELEELVWSEERHQALVEKVRDPIVSKSMETMSMDEVERRNIWFGWFVRTSFAVIVVLALYGGYRWFSPPAKLAFDPLASLSYETLAMFDDSEGDRIYLPSDKVPEVEEYLNDLPFRVIVRPAPKDWQVVGSSIIDYEVAKVAAVQYERKEDRELLVYYAFAGSLSDLPKTPPGKANGVKYQAYASDQLNLVAWQEKPNLLAFVAGRLSAAEIVELLVR